jgi:hypothetical protein
MPTSLNDDEKRLRRYLLKIAPEEELDRIEETYLATSGHAEVIGDAETRLVSDYVQGRLSGEEKQAFERNYLVTGERQEQLAVAQALGQMENILPWEVRGRSVLGDERLSMWRRFLGWIAAPGPIVGFATAAVTVVLLSTNVVLFLRWRDQAHQTEAASLQIRTLEGLKENTKLPVATARGVGIPALDPQTVKQLAAVVAAARVVGLPVLKVEETSLSGSEKQKLTFRLAADVPDAIEIPLEVPAAVDGAAVDVTLFSSGRQIWAESAIRLRNAGKVLQANLIIPFSVLQPHIGELLKLVVVERGHADLGAFGLIFEVER